MARGFVTLLRASVGVLLESFAVGGEEAVSVGVM
jgi:hypothetical protein